MLNSSSEPYDTIITQVLVTIQGEGISIGSPVLLIRMGGCNLNCSFCDTKWTNQFDRNKIPFFTGVDASLPYRVRASDIGAFKQKIKNDLLSKYKIDRVLFTGGEPLMNVEFIRDFMTVFQDSFKIYEIETNGLLIDCLKSIIPFDGCGSLQLNISPKFIEYPEKYFRSGVMRRIIDRVSLRSNYISDSFIKLVYDPKYNKEYLRFINLINRDIKVVFTPMTPEFGIENFNELYQKSCVDTIEFCLKHGLKYSPREHVMVFKTNLKEFDGFK